jgi:hypothetical protein
MSEILGSTLAILNQLARSGHNKHPRASSYTGKLQRVNSSSSSNHKPSLVRLIMALITASVIGPHAELPVVSGNNGHQTPALPAPSHGTGTEIPLVGSPSWSIKQALLIAQ